MATHYATVELDSVGSTQDEARKRARAGSLPVLVVAQRQIAGRGRTGRTWLEAPRAMYSSLAFRPHWPAAVRSRLTLVAGVAVREAVAAQVGLKPGLKWPNDLVLPTGKLGGILTEAEDDVVVIGCGVNLWWDGAPPGVAALCSEDPGPELGSAIADGWASHVLDVAAGDPEAWPLDSYRAACVTIGADIAWSPAGRGTAVDVDFDGALVVETSAGTVHLTSGEVHTVRPATVAADRKDDRGDETR